MTDYVASPGNPVSGVTLQSGDTLTVSSGGLATSDTVSSGGAATVLSGGTASALIVEGTVLASGTLISTIVLSGGVVSNNTGTVQGGTIADGGREVDSLGTVSGLVLASGGVEIVESNYTDLTVSGTIIQSGGGLLVSAGTAGPVSGVILSSGGILVVLPGGAANGTVLDGGSVVSTGVVQLLNSGLVAVGLVDTPTTLGGGEGEFVLSGGTGSSTTLGSGASEIVYAGGQATSATVLTGGTIEINVGATASGLMVTGTAVISGDTNGLTAQGGETEVFGTVENLTMTGGQATVNAGATATSGSITGSAVVDVFSGTLSGFSLGDGGSIEIFGGGQASGIVVSTGGTLDDSSSGTASGTIVLSGASEIVSYQGTSVDTVVAGGSQTINDSGMAIGAAVDAAGVQYVYSSGVTSGATVFSGGTQIISGGTAVGTIVSGGVINVDTGVTSGALLLAGGQEIVGESAGDPTSAVGTEIGSGAVLVVLSGSTVTGTVLDAGGRLVLAGGTAVGTIDQGGETDQSGILLQDFTTNQTSYVGQTQTGGIVGAEQNETVFGSAVVTSTTVTSGGMLTVNSGGTAIAAQLSDAGLVFISSGGTAIDGVVSSGGLFGVLSGGVASNTDVQSSGIAGTIGGGMLVGTTIETGGLVGVLEGEADNTDVKSDGGLAVLGGVASGTLVENGGVLGVDNFDSIGFGIGAGSIVSVGSAADTTLQAGGYFVPLPGTVDTGLVNDGGTIVNSGVFVAVPFVSATFYPSSAINPDLSGFSLTYVGSGGLLSGGALATPINLIGAGGVAFALPSTVRVLPGGTVEGLSIAAGELLVNGGVTSGVSLDSTEFVNEGGVDSAAIIDAGGSLDVLSGGQAVDSVVSSGATIVADDPTSIISGAAVLAGGAVLFSNITYTVGVTSASFDTATDQLTLSDGDPADTRSVTLDSIDANADFQVAAIPDSSDYVGTMVTVESIACYCRGPAIATVRGDVPVERLIIGDQVVTASGSARSIRWIGRRSYAGVFAANNPDVLPILFRAGSLGASVPRRDLWVSPLHAMFIDGVLVPARLLVNGVSILVARQIKQVEYFHIELDTHDILLAEGAPAESFVDDDSRTMFHNAAEYGVLYPDALRPPARYCAPRVEDGVALASVQRKLAAFAYPQSGQGAWRGYLDSVDRGKVTGWARRMDETAPHVKLAILVNGAVVGEIIANQERDDLRSVGEGDGCHAFSFAFPGGLSPHIRHTVAVRRMADGGDLYNSPAVMEPAPLALAAAPSPVLPFAGLLDHFDRDRVTGWAWQSGQDGPTALQVWDNGKPLLRILANFYRADLQEAGIGDGRHGFDIVIPGGLSPLSRHVLEIRRESDGATLPGTPVTLEPSDSFDPALARAVERAVAALESEGQQDTVLSFLVSQTEQLLQRRAERSGGAEPRQALAQFRRRWGAKTDRQTDAPAEPSRRALVIDSILPVQGRDAGSEAVLSHMRTLCELGYAVSIVAAETMTGSCSALAATEVSCLGRPTYASVEDVLRRQAGFFDVIYLHRGPIASRYLQLARQYMPRARVIYSVADLHHLRMARQAAVEDRPQLLAASRAMRVLECTTAWAADAVITHSADEAAELRRIVPGASVHVVPWAMPVAAALGRARRTPFAARAGLAFIGHGAHAPNVDAAHWLVGTIMPLVWQTDPTIECILVGDALPKAVRALAGPGVTVLGHVTDLHALLNRVRLTVAPLRYGAGVKGKVLASWAARVPCVMTPVASEGLALPPRLQNCVGKDADELAARIVQLHGDKALNHAAGKVGVDVIRHDWSEAAVATSLEAALTGRKIALKHSVA